MTEEQLDGVSGGPHYKDFSGVTAPIQQRRSNRTRYIAEDVDADVLLPAVQAVAFEGLGVVFEDLHC